MLGSKIPTEIDKCSVVLALGIEGLYTINITHLIKHFLRGLPSTLHMLILMPCSYQFSNTCRTNIKSVSIVRDYRFHVIIHLSSLIEHVEHDAGVEQISHRLQVCKLSNHLVELHLLFGSKRSPSVLDLIIISILKPGKPAGSARVLICSCCHHNFFCFISSVQRYEKVLILIVL